MGANIEISNNGVKIIGKELNGCEIDLNETPDLLPVMSVVACFAKDETKLVNVAHARIKETDRITSVSIAAWPFFILKQYKQQNAPNK